MILLLLFLCLYADKNVIIVHTVKILRSEVGRESGWEERMNCV